MFGDLEEKREINYLETNVIWVFDTYLCYLVS